MINQRNTPLKSSRYAVIAATALSLITSGTQTLSRRRGDICISLGITGQFRRHRAGAGPYAGIDLITFSGSIQGVSIGDFPLPRMRTLMSI